jgi:hypothetical protein
MLAFALVFYEEFEDADNPDQPARARYCPGHRQRDAAARGPPRGCLVGAPGAAFAVIEDPENEAGESDALRGVRYPVKRQSI